MASTKPILAVGTMDSKGPEIAYIAACIRKTGCTVLMVDVGCSTATSKHNNIKPDVSREEVASFHPAANADRVKKPRHDFSDRGEAVTFMGEALVGYCNANRSEFSGIIGIGGSGGTALITPSMRSLPVGFPKVMVSTMASGDVAPYVGCTDITMMYSVADVAGINKISSVVMGNAANCMSGMVRWGCNLKSGLGGSQKPTLGMTMFGVTTPCCDAVRESLQDDYEVVVFHATGSGGRALEKLVSSGLVSGILDLTTTEVADEVVGGVLSAGPERMDAIVQSGLPCVMSLGALDMVNFGGIETVPAQWNGRLLHVHNSEVTLMRTSVEENRKIAAFIAKKINQSIGPLTLLIPEKGVSIIDVPGMPFHDSEADKALFEELEKLVHQTETRKIVKVPCAINDPLFAQEAVREFQKIASLEVELDCMNEEPPTIQIPAAAPGPRDEILHRLKSVVASGKPIVGGGAGTGISAKFEEKGGADLIVVYNSGMFRMGGHGSLAGLMPYKDANAIMLQMGEEILPVLQNGTPLLAGVCGTDPFRRMERLLSQVKDLGFAGVQNFPTVGLIDGVFRKNIEETGMSYQKEVDMIALAHKMGLLTTPYVFSPEDAVKMATVGADLVVAHMGLTTSGSIGASTALTLEECVGRIQAIVDAAKSVNPDILVLSHGGPISMPKDAQFIQSNVTGIHGFYGASSMERLPVEIAIKEQTQKFKSITLN